MICLEFMKVLILASCALESMYKEYVAFPPGCKLQESMNHSSHLGTAHYRTIYILHHFIMYLVYRKHTLHAFAIS